MDEPGGVPDARPEKVRAEFSLTALVGLSALPVFLRRGMSPNGPRRQLVRCNEMSEVEVKANSKSTAQFGRK